MSKKIFAVLLMLMLIPICQSQAATTYTFEITEHYATDGIVDINDKIGAFTSNISGIAGTDWVIDTISAPYSGWYFDEGDFTLPNVHLFGGSDFSYPPDAPVNSGIVLTIIAPNDYPLVLSDFIAYNYLGPEFTGDYSASLTPSAVPIPGALWLLGSGLVGMVGVRRKLGKA